MGRDPHGPCLGVAVSMALPQGGGLGGKWGEGGWEGLEGPWGCWSKRI